MQDNKLYYTQYIKYKTKYLNLKSQIGRGINNTNNTNNINFENEYLTNNLDTNSKFYYEQNLFNYWISSSHNTYLPHDQVFGPSSVCYYRLQSTMYLGGCLEIDTDSVSSDKNDIFITHLPTNSKQISLRSILRIIYSSIMHKKQQNILSGPIILTFDNKKLSSHESHNIFWKVIEEELINKDPNIITRIDDNFNISKMSIASLSNKILLRWNQNEKCTYQTPISDKVGKELCQPPKNILDKISSIANTWVHIKKGHIKIGKSIISDRNLSVSINVPFINKYTEPNINTIINTQRNILRMYPHFSSVRSDNYDNLKYFRDGSQMVATNLQKISEAWYLNKAVFLPNTGLPCSPNEILNNKCNNGWINCVTNNKPLAYRLKPLWLIGLIPHPGYYNLSIQIINVEQRVNNKFENVNKDYHNVKITEGLDFNKDSISDLNNTINLRDIDISVPFFIIQIKKSSMLSQSTYKSGIEIPWSIQNLSDKIQVDLYKIKQTRTGSYNDVELFDKNTDDDCSNSFLFNTNKQLRVTLEYTWTKSKEINSLKKYNDSIIALRNKFNKPTIKFLSNLELLNTYQDELAKLLTTSNINNTITGEEIEQMEQDSDDYEKQMEKYVQKAKTEPEELSIVD
jgi:hypothetical protein